MLVLGCIYYSSSPEADERYRDAGAEKGLTGPRATPCLLTPWSAECSILPTWLAHVCPGPASWRSPPHVYLGLSLHGQGNINTYIWEAVKQGKQNYFPSGHQLSSLTRVRMWFTLTIQGMAPVWHHYQNQGHNQTPLRAYSGRVSTLREVLWRSRLLKLMAAISMSKIGKYMRKSS